MEIAEIFGEHAGHVPIYGTFYMYIKMCESYSLGPVIHVYKTFCCKLNICFLIYILHNGDRVWSFRV